MGQRLTTDFLHDCRQKYRMSDPTFTRAQSAPAFWNTIWKTAGPITNSARAVSLPTSCCHGTRPPHFPPNPHYKSSAYRRYSSTGLVFPAARFGLGSCQSLQSIRSHPQSLVSQYHTAHCTVAAKEPTRCYHNTYPQAQEYRLTLGIYSSPKEYMMPNDEVCPQFLQTPPYPLLRRERTMYLTRFLPIIHLAA